MGFVCWLWRIHRIDKARFVEWIHAAETKSQPGCRRHAFQSYCDCSLTSASSLNKTSLEWSLLWNVMSQLPCRWSNVMAKEKRASLTASTNFLLVQMTACLIWTPFRTFITKCVTIYVRTCTQWDGGLMPPSRGGRPTSDGLFDHNSNPSPIGVRWGYPQKMQLTNRSEPALAAHGEWKLTLSLI